MKKSTALVLIMVAIFYCSFAQPYPHLHYRQNARNEWQILQPYQCYIKTSNKCTYIYNVMPGYTTNFRSGPAFIDIIVSQLDSNNNNLNIAWLIHDINYEGYRKQEEADEILYSMLLNAGVPDFNASIIYWGLRGLGRFHWGDFHNNLLINFDDQFCKKNNKSGMIMDTAITTLIIKEPNINSFSKQEQEEIKAKLKEIMPEKSDKKIEKLLAE